MTKKENAPENVDGVGENPNGKERIGAQRGISKEAWAALATIAAALIGGTFLMLTHLIPPASPTPTPMSASSTPTTSPSRAAATSASSAPQDILSTSTPQSSSSESAGATRFPDSCLNQKLAALQDDRKETAAIEGGEPDVITGNQSKDGLAGVWLLANNRLVGAVTFSPMYVDSKNYSFKVEHLLDSKCQETNYVNVDHPENKPVLRNWDRIRVTFDSQEYWLRLGYNTQTHAISAKFRDKEIQ